MGCGPLRGALKQAPRGECVEAPGFRPDLLHAPKAARNCSGGEVGTTRWVAYQPVPAMIDPLRWVPSMEPSFGASP
jgi:hypothetical protein